MFAWQDGTLYRPDYVSRLFRTLAERFDLPVITLHDGAADAVVALLPERKRRDVAQ